LKYTYWKKNVNKKYFHLMLASSYCQRKKKSSSIY